MTLGRAVRSDQIEIHRDTADNYAVPVLQRMGTFSAHDYEKTREAIKTMMDTSKFVGNVGGKIEAKLTMSGQVRLSDPDRAALAAAQAEDVATELTLVISIGDVTVTGTEFDKAPWIVTSLKISDGENGVSKIDAELALGDCVLNPPELNQLVP